MVKCQRRLVGDRSWRLAIGEIFLEEFQQISQGLKIPLRSVKCLAIGTNFRNLEQIPTLRMRATAKVNGVAVRLGLHSLDDLFN